MIPSLVPYVGYTGHPRPRPMSDAYIEDRAFNLFHSGSDTVAIAVKLRITQAAAANALARVRDRERSA